MDYAQLREDAQNIDWSEIIKGCNVEDDWVAFNPLDAGRRLTDFSQTSYVAGSRLTYKTVNQRSGS